MTSVSPLASSTTDRGAAEWTGRQTPWSNEAEQAGPGCMVLDHDAALKAAEVLDDTMFYREAHRLLFRSMLSLTERGDVIDPVTLRDELSRRGDLDRAGGMEYIAALIDVVPTAANVDYHAKIVRDKAVMRRLVEAATGIIQDIYEGHGTAGEVLDNAEHRVFQVAQSRRAEEFVRIKELIWPTMERIEQLQSGAGALTGVPRGFVDLDRYTAGFQRSVLGSIAGAPPPREPPAGNFIHLALAHGARQRARRAGRRHLAAVARPGAARRRAPAAAALRPARVGRDRARRRRRLLHLSAGVLRRARRSQDEREHRRHRGSDRRQAAQRPDRDGEAALQEGIHPLRQLHRARGSRQCLKASPCFAVPNAAPISRNGAGGVTRAGRGIPWWKRRS